MNDFDPGRAALLCVDFQNYGIHPHGYWATHGEPEWPEIARTAMENTTRVLAAARQRHMLVVHVGLAWREGAPDVNMGLRCSPALPTARWSGRGDRSSATR